MVEHLDQPPLDILAHDVFPAARLGVHVLPVQADDVDQQAFGEAMFAHHRDSHASSLVGQLEMTVTGDQQETVALHASDGLAHRRTTLLEALGDPGAEGHHALLLEVVDGTEVHLRGVDQILHLYYPFVGTNSTHAQRHHRVPDRFALRCHDPMHCAAGILSAHGGVAVFALACSSTAYEQPVGLLASRGACRQLDRHLRCYTGRNRQAARNALAWQPWPPLPESLSGPTGSSTTPGRRSIR